MVWMGLAVILLNLDRFSVAPVIPVAPYLLLVILLPCLLMLGLWAWKAWWHSRQPVRQPAVALAAVEALDETAELDL
jgi:hypothetical protein